MSERELTHLDNAGGVHMVDVGAKAVTVRTAKAQAVVRASAELIGAIRRDGLKKGNAIEVAKLAGVLAAKRTDELIPLCHSLPLDAVDVDAEVLDDAVRLTATVRTAARTGVEMEALTAVSVAALTVIDMGKAIDRGMVIERVRLLSKTGGARGDYHAVDQPDDGGNA